MPNTWLQKTRESLLQIPWHLHRAYNPPVHPAGGQLITVQRRGADAGEGEEPARPVTGCDVLLSFRDGLPSCEAQEFSGDRAERPDLHAGGAPRQAVERRRRPRPPTNTCRGRGIREPSSSTGSAEQSATPNNAGHPASPGPPLGPRRQRTSMRKRSGAFGACEDSKRTKSASSPPAWESGRRGNATCAFPPPPFRPTVPANREDCP